MVSKVLKLTELGTKVLSRFVRERKTKSSLQERSMLIEMMGSGYSNLRIEKETGLSVQKARRWRAKWLSFEGKFLKIEEEFEGTKREKELEKAIVLCLSDDPRPGAPCIISTEQYCQILGVSLEPPEKSGRPITHWTMTELADEVIKRGIVGTISRVQVWAFLKGERHKAVQNSGLAEPELYPGGTGSGVEAGLRGVQGCGGEMGAGRDEDGQYGREDRDSGIGAKIARPADAGWTGPETGI